MCDGWLFEGESDTTFSIILFGSALFFFFRWNQFMILLNDLFITIFVHKKKYSQCLMEKNFSLKTEAINNFF